MQEEKKVNGNMEKDMNKIIEEYNNDINDLNSTISNISPLLKNLCDTRAGRLGEKEEFFVYGNLLKELKNVKGLNTTIHNSGVDKYVAERRDIVKRLTESYEGRKIFENIDVNSKEDVLLAIEKLNSIKEFSFRISEYSSEKISDVYLEDDNIRYSRYLDLNSEEDKKVYKILFYSISGESLLDAISKRHNIIPIIPNLPIFKLSNDVPLLKISKTYPAKIKSLSDMVIIKKALKELEELKIERNANDCEIYGIYYHYDIETVKQLEGEIEAIRILLPSKEYNQFIETLYNIGIDKESGNNLVHCFKLIEESCIHLLARLNYYI